MALDCLLEVSRPAADTLLLGTLHTIPIQMFSELKTFLFEVDYAGQYLMCHCWFMERLGCLPCSASPHPHGFCTNFVVKAAQPIRSLHVNKPTFERLTLLRVNLESPNGS